MESMTDDEFRNELNLMILDENDEIVGIQGLPDEYDYTLKASEIPPEGHDPLPLEQQAIILRMAELNHVLQESTGIADAELVYDTFMENDITITETVDPESGESKADIVVTRPVALDDFTWRVIRQFGTVDA